jgi:AmmeMemoRadiSam system protein A
VARAAVHAAAHGLPPPPLPPDLPARLREPAGAFVSLHHGPDLRGCIGSVSAQASLAGLVARMATAAATRDPRFTPLRPEDLSGLHIEISILSPTRPVTVDEIDPAAHGLSLRLGRHGAVLLPQVATRYRWDRMTLLVHLCEKGGLPATAWQDPAATLLAFTVETVEGVVQAL